MRFKGKGYNVVGVILARGKSKGLPGKNIKLLSGTPLIAYSIDASLSSGVIDRTIVTTDDERIADIAGKYKAEVPFLRPKRLARDTTHTPEVIEHAINYLERKEGYRVDVVVTLQPTSPFRTDADIRRGVKKFLKTKSSSLVSVCLVNFSPYWMVKMENGKLKRFVDDGVDYFCLERQQLPKIYQPNGALYVTRRDILRDDNVIIGENPEAIIMNKESSIDIDGPEDFMLAEYIVEKNFIHKRNRKKIFRYADRLKEDI